MDTAEREKLGRQYHYYNCKNARKKKCKKKIVSKQLIEDRVVAECLKLLTDEKYSFYCKDGCRRM